MNIVKREPRGLSVFDRFGGLDDFFDDFIIPPQMWSRTNHESLLPRVDISAKDNAYLIEADLPGVSKDDISVSFKDGLLFIEATTKTENKEEKDGQLLRCERHYGKFVRKLSLGDDVQESDIHGEFKDGVLSLTLPKKAKTETKQIEVKIQ